MSINSHIILFNKRLNKSNHDLYQTSSWAIQVMLTELLSELKVDWSYLEPCNGYNVITDVLDQNGFKKVYRLDIDQDCVADEYVDFLNWEPPELFNCVVMNPPYKLNNRCEFINKALQVVEDKGLVITLSRILFVESAKRADFFKQFPPKYILVHKRRLAFGMKSGIGYAWFVFQKGHQGPTILKWI